jgi:hypothetical protein
MGLRTFVRRQLELLLDSMIPLLISFRSRGSWLTGPAGDVRTRTAADCFGSVDTGNRCTFLGGPIQEVSK